jgi:DnaK suppressor protein
MDTMVARERLEGIRTELDRSILVLTGEHEAELTAEYPPDAADVGTSISESERAEAVLVQARGQLAEVRSALARLEQGTYGVCTDCGKGVPEGRLEAKPEAARCVNCQGKRDRSRR